MNDVLVIAKAPSEHNLCNGWGVEQGNRDELVAKYKELSRITFDSYLEFGKKGEEQVDVLDYHGQSIDLTHFEVEVTKIVKPDSIVLEDTRFYNNLFSRDSVPIGEAVKVSGEKVWEPVQILDIIYNQEYGWETKKIIITKELDQKEILQKLMNND